jgi:predicted Rossmann fold flavoprotein
MVQCELSWSRFRQHPIKAISRMHDVVIIGAGAAGLMAAARASQRGAATLVLEKNNKTGVKILMSGGTRCNITHDCDSAGIMEAFGRGGRFLRQALDSLGPRETVAMFNSLGVATKVESTGKVFPQSDRALQVRDALEQFATTSGATIRRGASVDGFERQDDRFVVWSGGERIESRRVIVTCGGRSWPGCGTTGDGYAWMEKLGHTIVRTRPALVPLTGGFAWTKELSGLTLDRAAVRVWQPNPKGTGFGRKPTLERIGGFLFTHLGFSGPTIMDVSGVITAEPQPGDVRFECDWLPDMPRIGLEQWFDQKRSRSGSQRVTAALAELLPKRLAEAICLHHEARDTPFGELAKSVRTGLIDAIKQAALPITGTRGFEKAEVTAGGVDLREVDPRTMESRIVPGMYIAGEILDLDGWIGGYNFQSAFSTGYLAGTNAAAE